MKRKFNKLMAQDNDAVARWPEGKWPGYMSSWLPQLNYKIQGDVTEVIRPTVRRKASDIW